VLFPIPKSAAKARVVITGAGMVTALGLDWNSNAQGFRAGQTAFRSVSLFDVSRHRVKTAAEVDVPSGLPATRLSAREEGRLDRAARLLLLAATQAWEQARWTGTESIPVVLGTTSGSMTMGQDYYKQACGAPHDRRVQATRVTQYQSQSQALTLCKALGFSGPVTIIANACASGANALGHAWSLVRSGHAQRILTGGYDALSELVFAGFGSLQALSPTACRPFDATRDGLALGEGAAVFTLETFEHARQRGAKILGEIVGYGAVNDAHHLTQPQPAGNAAFDAMTLACQSANVAPGHIGYVNAHGTATPLNDSAEAAAINRWAGPCASQLAVSSTKASIGHLLGAAGAVEVGVCLMALQNQWLPPTATTTSVDPLCAFRLVTKPERASLDYALTNSFGFGGANASVVLKRWNPS
jgi:3-oxoacyl-[acyl-carrier-protein] synthase II